MDAKDDRARMTFATSTGNLTVWHWTHECSIEAINFIVESRRLVFLNGRRPYITGCHGLVQWMNELMNEWIDSFRQYRSNIFCLGRPREVKEEKKKVGWWGSRISPVSRAHEQLNSSNLWGEIFPGGLTGLFEDVFRLPALVQFQVIWERFAFFAKDQRD